MDNNTKKIVEVLLQNVSVQTNKSQFSAEYNTSCILIGQGMNNFSTMIDSEKEKLQTQIRELATKFISENYKKTSKYDTKLISIAANINLFTKGGVDQTQKSGLPPNKGEKVQRDVVDVIVPLESYTSFPPLKV